MTVCTWYTSERAAGLPIGIPTQNAETRGDFSKCYAVDVEQIGQDLFVTVAARSLKECLAEFRHTASSLDIPAKKWEKFEIPLTENAIRAVNAWAEAVRNTIEKCREQATADSPKTL